MSTAALVTAGLAGATVLAGRGAWLGWSGAPRRTVAEPAPARHATVPAVVLACCDAADGDLDPARAWRWYRAGLVVAPAAMLALAGPPLAAVALAGLVAGPHVAGPILRRRRDDRRDLQLAPFLERVASSIRSGRSVRTAFTEVARDVDRPLRTELAPVTHALEHGAALDAAVDGWAGRPGAGREVGLAAAALRLGAEAGGEVARAVDGVAASLRERREVQGELVALATQARTSAALLVVAPVGFAGLMSTVEPGAVRFLVGTPIGLLCLVAGLTLDAVGGWWMQRIVGRAR